MDREREAAMRAIFLLFIAILLLLSGCTSHPILEHYRPLEDLSERPAMLGNSMTTIHTTVWVDDIEDYLKRKPEGSHLYNADMIHERIHSLRMGNVVTTGWFILKYLFSTEFMWEEESICWYFQLMYLKNNGIQRPPQYTASFLSNSYDNLVGSMIDEEAARKWVEDVYSGNWEPSISPEEWDLYYNDIIRALIENAK